MSIACWSIFFSLLFRPPSFLPLALSHPSPLFHFLTLIFSFSFPVSPSILSHFHPSSPDKLFLTMFSWYMCYRYDRGPPLRYQRGSHHYDPYGDHCPPLRHEEGRYYRDSYGSDGYHLQRRSLEGHRERGRRRDGLSKGMCMFWQWRRRSAHVIMYLSVWELTHD